MALIYQLRHSECNKLFAKVLHRDGKTIISFKCPRCSKRLGSDVFANFEVDILEAEVGNPRIEIRPGE